MAWKYYEAEEKRWAFLHEIETNPLHVASIYRRWCQGYFERPKRVFSFRLIFRRYESIWSWTTKKEIVLTYPVNLLLAAHEFAHLIQWDRGHNKKKWHDKTHRALVDTLCTDLIRHEDDLKAMDTTSKVKIRL